MNTRRVVLPILGIFAALLFQCLEVRAAAPGKTEPFADGFAEASDGSISNYLQSLVGIYDRPAGSVGHFASNGPFLGNGDMRVVLLGTEDVQTFHISEADMWSDGGGGGGIRQITTGGLTLTAAPVAGTAPARFRQEQHLWDPHILAQSRAGFCTRSMVCARENVMVVELWTESRAPLPMTVSLWAKADDKELPAQAGIRNGLMWVTRETKASRRWVSRNALVTKITGCDAAFSPDGPGRVSASFTLSKGSRLFIVTALTGGRNVGAPLPEACALAQTLDASAIARIQQDSAAWWRAFWEKAWLRTYDETWDKVYFGGLYLMACVNRAGNTPAGQYPLCMSDDPGWHGDYHLNQEYLGQYCWAFSGNRPEILKNVFQPLLDFIPEGEKIARLHMKDVHGSFGPHQGICYPVGIVPGGICSDYFFGNQVSDASYSGQLFVWNFEYYQNLQWLAHSGYPYLRLLGDFWESHLRADSTPSVTASSEESNKGNFAVNAMDGDPSTRWCASGPWQDQWLCLDLGRTQTVGTVAINWDITSSWTKNTVPYYFVIEGSINNEEWTVLADYSKAPLPANRAVLPVHGTCRFLRIRTTAIEEAQWASIREIKLAGPTGRAILLPPPATTGRLVSYGATWECRFGKNDILDLALARRVLTALTAFSRDLGVDEDMRSKWQATVDRLSDWPTMTVNGKRVFVSNEGCKALPGNCDLEGPIFPSGIISLSSPDELKQTAINTLAIVKQHWAAPKLGIFGARIGYPAQELFAAVKAGSIACGIGDWMGLRQNMTIGDFHGTGELLEFLQEAMLQSDNGGITLFPCPPSVRHAAFNRLRAVGAFLVSAQLTDGVIGGVKIISEKGHDCTVVNPWSGKTVRIIRDGRPGETVSGTRFTFRTENNESIGLEPQ